MVECRRGKKGFVGLGHAPLVDTEVWQTRTPPSGSWKLHGPFEKTGSRNQEKDYISPLFSARFSSFPETDCVSSSSLLLELLS